MRSYSAIPNLMTLQGRGFGPFFSGLFPGPSIHRGAFVAPKTCDLQGIASPPFLHVAVEYPSLRSGERYFLSGPDQAAVFGLLLFSGFRRPRSHPLTRSLQAISDTKVDRRILPDDEPGHIFLEAPAGVVFIVKKINPGRPGHSEVIFFKNIPRNPRSGL